MSLKNKSNIFQLTLALLCMSVFLLACSGKEKTENEVSAAGSALKAEAAEPADGVGREKNSSVNTIELPEIEGDYFICIDPGHGFVDGGCGDGIWADGTLEKDINLAIANKLNEDLKELGFSTIMTHNGTEFAKANIDDGNQIFNPNERVAYVNTLDIDYFISIHVNSYADNPSTSGIRIYYENDNNWRKTGKDSEAIAQAISSSIISEMKPSPLPEIYDQNTASYAVVRETMAAASLIEVGFCTNPDDAENMVDDEWQNELAKAIADGLYTYFSGKNG